MRNGRRWRITAIATVLLALLSQLAAPLGARAADTPSLTDLKTRLVYFTKAARTADRTLTLNALAAQSPFEGQLWTAFLKAWDAASNDPQLNFTPPAGLPDSGHTFIVLGGSLTSAGTLKAQTVNRLTVAQAALAAYPNSAVLVSGGAPKNGVTEALAMHDWLIANGIPEERITTETRSSSTVGNAKYSIAILATRPQITSYTLISDASHLRRAGVLFDAAVLRTQEKSGQPWGIARIANVAYQDKTITTLASTSTTSTIASEVAGMLGLSGYSALVSKVPAKAKLTALTITPPTRTTYPVGTQLDPAGLTATAVYDNGAGAVVVTDQIKLSGFNASKVGSRKVTASYTADSVTKTASFVVAVTKASSSISLKPSTTKVKRNKTRVRLKVSVTSATGVPVTGKVTFTSGKKKLKTLTLVKGTASYRLAKFTTTGKKKITATYTGSKTVSAAKTVLTVTVKKK